MNQSEISQEYLVIDGKKVVGSRALGIENALWQGAAEDVIQDVLAAAVEGLQLAGIPAEIRREVPEPDSTSLSLLLPIVRLYLPVKELSKEFFGAVLAGVFATSMGVSPGSAAGALAPEAIRIFAMKAKVLSKAELEVVRTVIMVGSSRSSATSERVSLELGWDTTEIIGSLVDRDVLKDDGRRLRVEF